MKAIRIFESGGPEVLKLVDYDLPDLTSEDVLVSHQAIGVNFIDTYHRSGLYPLKLPSGLGVEAAGIVEAVGKGVQAFRPGDRVAYAGAPIGSYAEQAVVPAARLVPVPDELSFELAAASLLKGMTAEFLFDRCAPTSPGDWVLIHAAAGGVGQILTQWAHHAGAKIIALAGDKHKQAILEGLGVDQILSSEDPAFSKKVRDLTGGAGVKVVFDGVGRATFDQSLECLSRRGHMVVFGNASGPVPLVDPLKLSRMGSLYLTRPTLGDYTASPDELRLSASKVFERILQGKIQLSIGQTFPLSEAAKAHQALELRQTTGSTLLTP